jgi:hypothetical protein
MMIDADKKIAKPEFPSTHSCRSEFRMNFSCLPIRLVKNDDPGVQYTHVLT